MARVEVWAVQSPRGLWLSSPKVIGTVSGELSRYPPPHLQSPFLPVRLLPRLDQSSQDSLLECLGVSGDEGEKFHPHSTTFPILVLEPVPQARVLVTGCAVPEDGAEQRAYTKDTNTEGESHPVCGHKTRPWTWQSD